MSVSFDGALRRIIVDDGVSSLSVMVDVYSAWKRWVLLSDNSKYAAAMRSVGGDPLPGGQFLGATFFLLNGWKIRPYEGDHTLTLNGNLYSEDGSSPFVRTIGDFNVLIQQNNSAIVQGISTSGSTVDFADLLDQQFVEDNMTFRQAMRLFAAALGGRVDGAGTSVVTFRNAVADDKERIVAEVDETGNRTNVSYDLS
jgi:hypothetical protein